MAFQVYRVPPPTGPGTPAYFRFDELSRVDPATGRTIMHLAVVALGSGCAPPGPPDPSVGLRVGVGAPATLVSGTAVPVDGPAGPAGLATLSGSGVLLVEIEVLAAGSDWQIQLGVATGGTLVVADTLAEVRQPWTDAPADLRLATDVGRSTSSTVTIANRGTGPLTIANPAGAIGSGFSLDDVTPRTVAPNACATAGVTFRAPDDPGQFTATLRVGNDPNPSTAAGHNSTIQLIAVVRRPLWEPGDVLVTDLGGDDSSSGFVYRFNPALGQTVLSAAGHLVRPSGMAFDADGNLLVADNGPDGSPGWLLRIDRYTGVQTVLSDQGHFVLPAGVAVAPDGTIYVADSGPFAESGSVIKVDPSTGTQTVLTAGNLLQTPEDLLPFNGTIIVVRGDAFGGAGGLVRVNPAGNQSLLAGQGLFVDPSMRPQALTLEPNGTLLVAVTNGRGGSVLRISPMNGAQQRLAGLRGRPTGIATTADGRILVAVGPGAFSPPMLGVFEVDRVGGDTTPVSPDGQLKNPSRLVVVPSD